MGCCDGTPRLASALCPTSKGVGQRAAECVDLILRGLSSAVHSTVHSAGPTRHPIVRCLREVCRPWTPPARPGRARSASPGSLLANLQHPPVEEQAAPLEEVASEQRGQKEDGVAADERRRVAQAGGHARDMRLHQPGVTRAQVGQHHQDVVAHRRGAASLQLLWEGHGERVGDGSTVSTCSVTGPSSDLWQTTHWA